MIVNKGHHVANIYLALTKLYDVIFSVFDKYECNFDLHLKISLL